MSFDLDLDFDLDIDLDLEIKLFLVAFAVIAAVAADVSNEYLPPLQQEAVQTVAAPSNEYLAPVANDEASYGQVEQGSLAQDGYRYKTQRRRVLRRHRRDVSHLPSNDYLPPVQEEAQVVAAPTNEYLAPVANDASYAQVEQGNLADDGYRYKTHRRVVYRRNRRDVSHLPSNEYLPPVAQAAAPVPSNDYLPPVQTIAAPAPAPAPIQFAPVPEAAPAHELADDGYRYKTHRRVVYRRHRRDVSHLPTNEYLPPVQEEAQVVAAPTNEYLAPAAPAHELADDGYRYKTHRRVVYRRNRRDVSHLPSNEYLPPVAQAAAPVPSNDYLPPYAPVPEAAPAHELADDGYRYKTHRRVVYRRRH
ncbi:uncharacterized protein LOC122322601 [Drosophila grimshawi]|uniref:uncharacterized protein LOC122322601 n=1 Tax=Drosophila grimshawi TaxID=7222 RepID=UPI001C9326CD|nr:uncharacterized protein LOC122322601 [Drosophila grimshawi]